MNETAVEQRPWRGGQFGRVFLVHAAECKGGIEHDPMCMYLCPVQIPLPPDKPEEREMTCLKCWFKAKCWMCGCCDRHCHRLNPKSEPEE